MWRSYWGGWREQCGAVLAGPRDLDLAGHGGRRKEEEGREVARWRGSRGLLIGQRAPGRGEWHLGEASLVRGDSTASGRSEQAASCMAGRRGGSGVRRGRVLAWGGAKRQARWNWRAPSGPLGRGRAVDEVHRRRTAGGGRNRAAERGEMEVRAYLCFSENSGTSR